MTLNDPITHDLEWVRFREAIKTHQDESPSRLFISLYIYAKIKGIYLELPEYRQENYKGSINHSTSNTSEDNKRIIRVQYIRDKLRYLEQDLIIAATNGRFHDLYRPKKILGEFSDIVGIDSISEQYAIVPRPFFIDQDNPDLPNKFKQNGQKAQMTKSDVPLFDKWELRLMVVQCEFVFNTERLNVYHKHLSSYLSGGEKRLVEGMWPFKRRLQIAPCRQLRILLAAPGKEYNIDNESGSFYPNVGPLEEVDLDGDAKLLVQLCMEERADLLVLPEMLVTEPIKASLKNALKNRMDPYDGMYYPWLTLAGSCHIKTKSGETNRQLNRSTVLGPFGSELWYHDKICPVYDGDESERCREDISKGETFQLVDICDMGRTLVMICRDYLEISDTIKGQLSSMWPTFFLVPAYSKHLYLFKNGASQNRTYLRAATVVRNSVSILEPKKRQTYNLELEDWHLVVSNEEGKKLWNGIIVPQPLSSENLTFWTNLFIAEL